jgi:hypothetical protein
VRSPALASLSRFGASARTLEFGERQTLIGFLPEATQLRGPTRHFHLLSMGPEAPPICLNLPIPPGLFVPDERGKFCEGNQRE